MTIHWCNIEPNTIAFILLHFLLHIHILMMTTTTDEPITLESHSKVLLLGMVFAHDVIRPNRGQEFRDRVRCEALAQLGASVFTMDDKHKDDHIEEHCRANFVDTRRMLQSMKAKWGVVAFNHIILDYFFSPVGWARERWGHKFFATTLPAFATEGFMAPGGRIWLPHLECVQTSIDQHRELLLEHFDIHLVHDCSANPLYLATDRVEAALASCPDLLTNQTQIVPLLHFSDTPFLVLQVKQPAAHRRRTIPFPAVPLLPAPFVLEDFTTLTRTPPHLRQSRSLFSQLRPLKRPREPILIDLTSDDSDAEHEDQ